MADPPSRPSLPSRPAPSRSRRDRVGDVVVAVADRLRWFGIARAAAVSLCVLAVGAGSYWLVRAPAEPVEASLPRAGTTQPAGVPITDAAAGPTTASAAPGDIDRVGVPASGVPATDVIVHVAGAVVAPGVYRLDPGARVVDAVTAAGGATTEADTDAVNLAQVLADGDRVVIPLVADGVVVVPGVSGSNSGGAGASGSAARGGVASDGSTPTAPIDLNHADEVTLDELPGIGPATAAAIVAHREEHGPFASVDALADVRGIGTAKLEALRGLVTV